MISLMPHRVAPSMVSVHPTQLVHGVPIVDPEVSSVSVLGSQRAGEGVGPTVVTHHVGVGVSRQVEGVSEATLTVT